MHAEDGAGGQLRGVLVERQREGLAVDETRAVLLVEDLVEVLRDVLVSVDRRVVVAVDDDATVVRGACQQRRRVGHAPLTALGRQNLEADGRGTVGLGVLRLVVRDELEVSVERHVAEVRVAGVREHTLLDPERGTVVGAAGDVAVEAVVVREDVQALVYLIARVTHLLDVVLDVRGEVGVGTSLQHVVQAPESAALQETLLQVAGADEVGVLTAREHDTDLLVLVVRRDDLVGEGDTKLVLEQLGDLVVGCRGLLGRRDPDRERRRVAGAQHVRIVRALVLRAGSQGDQCHGRGGHGELPPGPAQAAESEVALHVSPYENCPDVSAVRKLSGRCRPELCAADANSASRLNPGVILAIK
ncbi:hypothetical protein ACFQY4_25930 [Catellatospora bangladeshensis]|uniref:hypothetical protein n=1 Tax=Catellatospora bangladeshensis TaxID=310355 RepID=UPI003608E645